MSRSFCWVRFLCGESRWRPWQRWQFAVRQLHEYSYERKHGFSTATTTSRAIPWRGPTTAITNNRTKAIASRRRRLKTSKIKSFVFSLLRPPQLSVFSAEYPYLAMLMRMAWCRWQPNQKPLNFGATPTHFFSPILHSASHLWLDPRIQTEISISVQFIKLRLFGQIPRTVSKWK